LFIEAKVEMESYRTIVRKGKNKGGWEGRHVKGAGRRIWGRRNTTGGVRGEPCILQIRKGKRVYKVMGKGRKKEKQKVG